MRSEEADDGHDSAGIGEPGVSGTTQKGVVTTKLAQIHTGLVALSSTYDLVREVVDEFYQEALRGQCSVGSVAALKLAKQKLYFGKAQLDKLSAAAAIVRVNCKDLLRPASVKKLAKPKKVSAARSLANKARFSASASVISLLIRACLKARGAGESMKAWRLIVKTARTRLSPEELGNGRFRRGTRLCPQFWPFFCLYTFS